MIRPTILPALLLALLPLAPALAASESIVLGMGCFWGAERRMSEIPGVLDVESGYAGGDAERVGYRDVLSLERQIRGGRSDARNHAEVVKVTFDPARVSLERVLIGFWENHDPTQGDRQGNDIGSNYRSAIYWTDADQRAVAIETRDAYQQALSAAGYGPITTEIAPLSNYNRAETYHQDYLTKNPDGYCGLGGTRVAYPGEPAKPRPQPLAADALDRDRQLIVFEAEDCPYCKAFRTEVLAHWSSDVPVVTTFSSEPPSGWTLAKTLFATPTMVLFEDGREVARYTGYQGDKERFWKWLGFQILTPEQQKIAFEQGTERAFTGSHLDEKRPGVFVDPITGAPLFRSDAKFDSGTGWPSFFNPVEGAITLQEDRSHGMRRIEVRSASSGIHLGHVFNDGPPPTGKRYCINGNVLTFVPDPE
ncbi:peptide-methionine (S)-S-oxide reductase MsrA [Thiococcus pfennigii]|jgi:peptide methionine sulfoxide reductase msrA/msrB|nr:peptide-methionine (S)-S-oxide reductase MsrA [Thiococcus pfennigii]MBK1700835.1 peptide methionine sulfoxide reductase [Thiococcus pfennigii]MBK1732066.1 peptide methionine sulfoxide reductase [Thiococcus pfennigii]